MLGRPKKPLEQRRRNKVQVSFTDEDLASVAQAAGNYAIGSWINSVAVKAAKKKNRLVVSVSPSSTGEI